VKVLVLSYRDVAELADMGEVVERAFHEKGLRRVQMPPKVYLFFNRYEGDSRAMPAYLESLNVAGVKLVNSHPRNPLRYNLPTVMAVIVLYDPETGRPVCIMNGTWMTGARTGAAAAEGVFMKFNPLFLGGSAGSKTSTIGVPRSPP